MSVYEAVEHLCGLQAQTTTSWYVGLWTRLDGFRPESVVDLIQARKLVRVVLMRSTIHLVTDRDCLAMRRPVQIVSVRGMRTNWGRNLAGGVDLDQVTAAGRKLLEEKPRTFSDERGRELYDLPDAPRPEPDTPAPVRFLYDFDNLVLSHDDRTRFLDADHRELLWPGNNRVLGAVLVDGAVRGSWRLERNRDSATLVVRSLRRPTIRDTGALTAEGLRLLQLIGAGASR